MTATVQPARSIVAVTTGLVLVAGFGLGTDALLRLTAPGGAAGVTGEVVLLMTAALGALYAVCGCYLAARLAPSRPMLHALGLGLLVLALAATTAAVRDGRPAWHHAVALPLILPAAWFGGRLREREIAYRAAEHSTIISG
jgi:hypothetical protein